MLSSSQTGGRETTRRDVLEEEKAASPRSGRLPRGSQVELLALLLRFENCSKFRQWESRIFF